MSKLKFNLFLIVIILTFTQGITERVVGLNSSIPQILLEFFVLFFIFFQFKIKSNSQGIFVLCLLILNALISAVYNENSVFEALLYLRYLIYSILIYYQLFYCSLGIKRWIIIFKLLTILIILQGIGSFFDSLILGERIEGYVGIMSSSGGTTASTFPLLISTLILLIFFYMRNINLKTTFLFLIVILSVFFVGYSSGKRAIYISIPLFFFISFLISLVKLKTKTFFLRKAVVFFIFILFFIPIFFLGVLNSKGFNYNLDGSESTLQIIESIISYSKEYESSTSDGLTIGRTNTTEKIYGNLQGNTSFLFFGEGYNVIKDETSLFKLGIGYGIVGITRDIISGGFILSLLSIILFLILINGNKTKTINKLSSSLRFILILIFLFVHLTYSSDFTVHLKLNLILFIFLSLINSPIHKNDYEDVMNNFKMEK